MRWDVQRDDWLGDGTWLEAPPFPGWPAIDLVIIHWPGANGVPHVGDDPADVFEYLRGQQDYYIRSRGYNLGYSGAVDWLGRRIEVRGDTCQNAANAPRALNARSLSIEVLTNLDGAMTDEQVAAVRDLCCQVIDEAHGATTIGHRDGPQYVAGATATSCPGDDIYARILNGEFDPQPGGDDDDMTEHQAKMLQAIYDALFITNPADPSTPVVHQTTQSMVCNRLWWDNYPDTIVDGPGSMARTLKRIATKLDVDVG